MAEVDRKSSPIGNAELAQRFVQFVMVQVQNIYYVLGRIPSPDGRPMQPNLEAAKILIDQLEMIQAKTEGNLSAQEGAILEDALKNVRLAFVETSGGTPASMMPKSNLPDFPLEDELADEPQPPPARAAAPEKPKAAPAPAASAPKPEEPENKKKFTKTYG
ncbi:MAG: DUF1844 domain-containing protein [Verrucomicrobiota bacterium]